MWTENISNSSTAWNSFPAKKQKCPRSHVSVNPVATTPLVYRDCAFTSNQHILDIIKICITSATMPMHFHPSLLPRGEWAPLRSGCCERRHIVYPSQSRKLIFNWDSFTWEHAICCIKIFSAKKKPLFGGKVGVISTGCCSTEQNFPQRISRHVWLDNFQTLQRNSEGQ